MTRVSPHLDRLATALLAGILTASLALTLAPSAYFDAVEARLLPEHPLLPLLTPRLLVTQGLMALFLFVLGKELYESRHFEGGHLAHGPNRRLITAALATALALPLFFWTVTGAAGLGTLPGAAGWSLTLGADLALAWVLGRRVFGPHHPALGLVLILALGLDIASAIALGSERLAQMLLPLDTPSQALPLLWLAPAGLALVTYARHFAAHAAPEDSERHHRRANATAPVVLTGLVLWLCTLMAGLPGALALLPLIPLIPHASRSLGPFAEAEALLQDPLNRLESRLMPALPAIAFLFGLTAGGIDLTALGADSLRALGAALLRGAGLVAGALIFLRLTRTGLPPGISRADIARIGLILVPGLTLPLLALDQGLGGGGAADAARAGLGLTLLALPLAIVTRQRPKP